MAVDGNRIRCLRKEAGLTQEALGKKLGVIKQTVSSWENNISEPNSEILSKIASIFNVPIGYLYGNASTNLPTTSIAQSILKPKNFFFFFFDNSLKEEFTLRLNKALNDSKITTDEFSASAKIDIEKCNSYLRGDCEPALEDLVKIANALNVSVDFLLGISERMRITAEEELLLQSFDRCDAECRKYLISKAGVLCVEGISSVAAGEYGKYIDEEKKLYPSNGTEGKRKEGKDRWD